MRHQHLPILDEAALKEELMQSKQNLEKLLGARIISFTYPYGDYGQREKHACFEAGYEFAIGTVNGKLTLGDDYYAIRRIQIFPSSGSLDFWKKTSGFYLRYCRLKGKDF
jgi:peptidoglycan/xylan/chitin deacetylase (PgdA/CDA1 family)